MIKINWLPLPLDFRLELTPLPSDANRYTCKADFHQAQETEERDARRRAVYPITLGTVERAGRLSWGRATLGLI